MSNKLVVGSPTQSTAYPTLYPLWPELPIFVYKLLGIISSGFFLMVKIILNQNKTFSTPKKWNTKRLFWKNHLGHKKGTGIDKKNDSNT